MGAAATQQPEPLCTSGSQANQFLDLLAVSGYHREHQHPDLVGVLHQLAAAAARCDGMD